MNVFQKFVYVMNVTIIFVNTILRNQISAIVRSKFFCRIQFTSVFVIILSVLLSCVFYFVKSVNDTTVWWVYTLNCSVNFRWIFSNEESTT